MTGWQIMFFAMVAFIGLVMLASYLHERDQKRPPDERLSMVVAILFGGCVTLAARFWWVGVVIAFGLVSWNAWAAEPVDTINAITDELDAGHAGLGGIVAIAAWFLREMGKERDRLLAAIERISKELKEAKTLSAERHQKLDNKLDAANIKIAKLETNIEHLLDK